MRTNKSIIFSVTGVLFIILALLTSCKSDSQKADELRINNKFDEAFELYQRASDNGDSYAKWRLSRSYDNGDGVDFSESISLKLLKEAADEGCIEAKCDLAFAYMFNWYGIENEEEKGKELLENIAKDTDNAFVLSRYAILYFYGAPGFEENKEKAMRILNKVKDKEDPDYLYMMGRVYMSGTDEIDIDEDKGIEYLTKAFDKGLRRVADELTRTYSMGYGKIKPDKSKAYEWVKKGIESNNTDCMRWMALACLSDDSLYNDVHNIQRGVELLKKAALHGDGDAYSYLGTLYYGGKHLPKDDSKAFDNWEKSTALRSGDGAFHLGFAYIEGNGCDIDIEKGIGLWEKAVEYGHGGAANNLFCHYNNGDYGGKNKRNKELAKKYLLKAAELGDVVGCFNLGREYFFGNNLMEKNNSQAFFYIQRAADKGFVEACNWMAYFYENGIGCNKDPDKAKEYKDKTKAKEDK